MYIGYLVGYEAINIYRVWVSNLNKVVKIRNVLFNKSIRYLKELESETVKPITITRDVIEEIEES